MDAGKTRNLQMALWDALIATRAAPARPETDTAKDNSTLPGARGGLPQVVLPNGKIDVPVAPRVAVALGGYSVNLSAAAVAASHIPLPRLRAREPAATNDPEAAHKPVSAARPAAHVYLERLELSTDDGILSVSNLPARPPGAIERDGVTVAPPLPPASPEAVRLQRVAYPTADEGPRPTMQAPAATAPSPLSSSSERLDPRAYLDPVTAANVAPRTSAAAESTPGTSAPQSAPPEMLVRTDAPPAQMSPAVLAAAAQLAAAEEAKAAARVLPRPAGELIHQVLGSPDSPAPTPELYRLIVGAAALGALLLLVL